MPCRTDHMEPTAAERHRKEAAQLAVFVAKIMISPPPDGTADAAQHIYGEGANEDAVVEWLCTQLRRPRTPTEQAMMFDIQNPTSRKLIEWWDEHKRVDAEREQREAAEKLLQKLDNVWIIWNSDGDLYHSFSDNTLDAEETAERLAREVGGAYAKAGFTENVKFPGLKAA